MMDFLKILLKAYLAEIDALHLDMAMPEMSGKDAYIGMKKINPQLTVEIN
ncbi:hypothetical protein ACFL20_08660 [Spirochaetota bacterium]